MNETIVTVKFSYTVQFVPKGKRNPIDYTIYDEAQAAIRVVTPEEAPTGLRFVPIDWYSETPLDHPWFEDRLWRPWAGADISNRDKRVTDLRELEDLLGGSDYDRSNPFRVNRSVPFHKRICRFEELPPGRTVSDAAAAREAILTRIASAAQGIIVRDGIVYVPSPEPVYSLIHESGWRRNTPEGPVYFLKTVPTGAVPDVASPNHYFSVTNLDDAVERIRQLETSRRTRGGFEPFTPDDVMRLCVWNRVEVLIPDCVRYRFDGRPRLERAVDDVLKTLRDEIGDRDVAFFTLYANFRDLAAAEPKDHDRLADMLANDVAPALTSVGLTSDAESALRAASEWRVRPSMDAVATADLATLA